MEKPETEKFKTNRELFLERMRSKYPDREYADDDALFGAINEDYDQTDKMVNEYKDRENAFVEMFNADPRSAAFLSKWRNGGNPITMLIEEFGMDIKEALDNPDMREEIAAAHKKYLERVAENTKLEDEYQKNLAESGAMLDEYQAKHGLTDEQINAAVDFINKIIRDGIVGKYVSESLDMAIKALNYDAAVEDAAHVGEVKGRNARIEEKLRKRETTDGTANLGGSKAGAAVAPKQNLGVLEKYGDGSKNIWERGGERRKKYNP